MVSIWFFFIFLYGTFVVMGTKTSKWDCATYYWKDYFGTIPADAVPAGNDTNGNPVYIGQVYIRNFELLPATIYPENGLARTTAYDRVFNTPENVKILCSPFPEAFQWIETKSKDLYKYYGLNLIPGGNEVGEKLYIGRVLRNGGVIIGKIFKHERLNRGIWFPFEGTHHSSLSYEILTYNCSASAYDFEKLCVPLDVRSGKVDAV